MSTLDWSVGKNRGWRGGVRLKRMKWRERFTRRRIPEETTTHFCFNQSILKRSWLRADAFFREICAEHYLLCYLLMWSPASVEQGVFGEIIWCCFGVHFPTALLQKHWLLLHLNFLWRKKGLIAFWARVTSNLTQYPYPKDVSCPNAKTQAALSRSSLLLLTIRKGDSQESDQPVQTYGGNSQQGIGNIKSASWNALKYKSARKFIGNWSSSLSSVLLHLMSYSVEQGPSEREGERGFRERHSSVQCICVFVNHSNLHPSVNYQPQSFAKLLP